MPYTYFLAHASPDKPLVRELRDRLTTAGVSCFLDEVDLLPGDNWAVEIPRAQGESAATLVMVSSRYDAAYYLCDEVHAAIARERRSGLEHRVVPIFVEGPPAQMPYGLGSRHGLDLSTLGMDRLVSRLAELAVRLGQTLPTTGLPSVRAEVPSSFDRKRLYDALCAIQLVSGMFSEILRSEAPEAEHHIASSTAAPAQRAADLVQWVSLQDGDVMARLCAAVKRRTPGLL